MTVEIVGGGVVNGVSNGTWFWLLDNCIGEILGTKAHTNDPIRATAEQARVCAKALRSTATPDRLIPSWLRDVLIDQFEASGDNYGFETY